MLSSVVKEYYEKAGIMPALLISKIKKFEKHPDVLAEFVEWIETGHYKETGCIIEAGYTAKTLSEKSVFFDGDGAFMLLIELREKPTTTIKKLSKIPVIR